MEKEIQINIKAPVKEFLDFKKNIKNNEDLKIKSKNPMRVKESFEPVINSLTVIGGFSGLVYLGEKAYKFIKKEDVKEMQIEGEKITSDMSKEEVIRKIKP